MKTASLFIFLYFAFTCVTPAEEPFQSTFDLVVARNASENRSHGILRWSETNLTVKVDSPVAQWMIFSNDTLTIYYPKTASGFIFMSVSGKTSLPVFELLRNAAREDLGFSALGYEIASHHFVNDTLVTSWRPPQKGPKILMGETTTYFVGDRLRVIKSTDKSGKLISSQVYSNYNSNLHKPMPLRIDVHTYGIEDSTYECLILGDPILDSTGKNDFISPTIPDSAKFKVVQW